MKKVYSKPQLIRHGNFAEITQAFGNSAATDTIFFNGQPFGTLTGSIDGHVVPGRG